MTATQTQMMRWWMLWEDHDIRGTVPKTLTRQTLTNINEFLVHPIGTEEVRHHMEEAIHTPPEKTLLEACLSLLFLEI